MPTLYTFRLPCFGFNTIVKRKDIRYVYKLTYRIFFFFFKICVGTMSSSIITTSNVEVVSKIKGPLSIFVIMQFLTYYSGHDSQQTVFRYAQKACGKRLFGGKLFFLIKIFNFHQKKQLHSDRFFSMFSSMVFKNFNSLIH